MKMNFSLEGMITGIGVALAASVILPMVKKVARPAMAVGIQGATMLGNEVKSRVGHIKEGIEDIVAEAQFERMRKQIDRDME